MFRDCRCRLCLPQYSSSRTYLLRRRRTFFEIYKGASYQDTTGDDTKLSFKIYGSNTATEEDEVESHNDMVGLAITANNDIGRLKLGYSRSKTSATDTSTPTSVPAAGQDGKRYSIVE